MKKIVLKNGVIGGLLMVSWFIVIQVFDAAKSIEFGEVIGYATIIAAMAFVFVGVSKERERNNGVISFKHALQVGAYIAGIASIFYVVGWLIVDSDNTFIYEYAASKMSAAKEAGKSAEELAALEEQMNGYKEIYENIFSKAAYTFLEVVPIAVPAPFLAALILKKK